MKKVLRLSLLFVFAAISGSSWAQERSVSGKVTSIDDGSTLPGVNVVIKGTTTGTITDFDGNYTVNVGDDATLIFSFIGYANEEVLVGARSVIDVQLSADVQQLSEVIVTAYGETTKKAITGSVGVVDAAMIENQQVVSIGRALQGTTPGVNIITGSGQPGANPTIRIRGVNSISSSAAPLIVLDGAIYEGNLNSINPDDVESMSVLKDAGSAALYGSRASNGVIMITTKSGTPGEAQINLSMSTGFSSRAVDRYEQLGTEDMMKLTWESMVHDAQAAGVSNPQQQASDNLVGTQGLGYNPYGPSFPNPINVNGELEPGASLLWETDWFDKMTRDQAMRKDVALSISGGSENMRYRFSTNYLEQEGEFNTSKFERITTRMNVDAQANDWLSMGMKAGFTYSNQNFPPQSGSSIKYPILFATTVSSIYPFYQRDENGQLIADVNGDNIFDYGIRPEGDASLPNVSRPIHANYNPAGTLTEDEYNRNRYHTNLNGHLRADFLENFYFKTNFALDLYLYDQADYSNFLYGDERGQGAISRDRDISINTVFWNQLGYSKTFNDHTVDAQIISEIQNKTYETLYGYKAGFAFAGLKEFDVAANTRGLTGALFQERYTSILGQVNYNFKDKYFFTGSLREDASSRFAKENRSAVFYSLGGGWVLSDESFLDGVGFVNSLKLRGSHGKLGNANLQNAAGTLTSYFPYLQVFDGGADDTTRPGVYTNTLTDSGIQWETSIMSNIGLDFTVLNNRLSGTVEVYKKTTDGLILNKPFSPSLGFGGSIQTNVGEVVNQGLELSLTSTNVQTADLTWTTSFNISFEQNEITDYPQEEEVIGSKRLRVGTDVYQFYIPEWAGVDPSDGAPMWYMDVEDADGNATGERTITKNAGLATDYEVGSALPTARGGFSTNVSYKGFSLDVLTNFSLGGKVLNYDYSDMMHGTNGAAGQSMHVDQLDRWQQPGDITSVPRLDAGGEGDMRSTRFLYDNSYLRLRNVTLSYNFNKNLLSKLGVFRTASVNIQGDNLLTFANAIDGMDPEQSISGTTNLRSAIYKTYSFGINLGF
jgi:TonB-linked SusC/RagA family outer membrane protein